MTTKTLLGFAALFTACGLLPEVEEDEPSHNSYPDLTARYNQRLYDCELDARHANDWADYPEEYVACRVACIENVSCAGLALRWNAPVQDQGVWDAEQGTFVDEAQAQADESAYLDCDGDCQEDILGGSGGSSSGGSSGDDCLLTQAELEERCLTPDYDVYDTCVFYCDDACIYAAGCACGDSNSCTGLEVDCMTLERLGCSCSYCQ